MSVKFKKSFEEIKEGTSFVSNLNEVFIVQTKHADPISDIILYDSEITCEKTKLHKNYMVTLYCVTTNTIMFSVIQYDDTDDTIYFFHNTEKTGLKILKIVEFI